MIERHAMILCVYNPKVLDKILKLQNIALHANICLHAAGYPCPVISTLTRIICLFFCFFLSHLETCGSMSFL